MRTLAGAAAGVTQSGARSLPPLQTLLDLLQRRAGRCYRDSAGDPELAAAIGVHPSHANRLRNGVSPSALFRALAHLVRLELRGHSTAHWIALMQGTRTMIRLRRLSDDELLEYACEASEREQAAQGRLDCRQLRAARDISRVCLDDYVDRAIAQGGATEDLIAALSLLRVRRRP